MAGEERYLETPSGAPGSTSPHVTPTGSTVSKTISGGGSAYERAETGKVVFTWDDAATAAPTAPTTPSVVLI
jgi:hypothetical protein